MPINIYDLVKSTQIVGEESLKKSTDTEKDSKKEDVNENTGWWKKSPDGKKRVMICGTYPIGTSNGYSKVVYYISKYLGLYDDISLTIYGFQNVNNTNDKGLRDDIPSSVKLHDVLAAENPKRNGFGELEIGDFIKKNPQDIIRAPHKMTGYLYTPEMMVEHHRQYNLRPSSWTTSDWGTNSNQKTGSICSGDSGSGYFVEENSVRYYVGTAGNGGEASNCKADGTFSYTRGGFMANFPSPNKFLDLIKSAETFVEEQKKAQLVKAEEARLAAELKAKQEAEAKAAELKAEKEAEAKAAVLKKTTITCLKGKLVKKVTAVKPVCPKGYKKK